MPPGVQIVVMVDGQQVNDEASFSANSHMQMIMAVMD